MTTQAPPDTDVVRTVLPNGLTVLVRRDASAPVVAIVTYVKAGYFDETDDVVGIAHVLEHMYFKGTSRRGVGEIARETKASGGYLNAHTIYDHTLYYTVLPASGFVAGLDIQFDAYADSTIDADELRRELEVIIQEVKRKEDNPHAVTTETLYELLHDAHRMRRWRIGREDALRALRRDQLVGFYRNFYRPSSTVLVVVGDVDPADALREIERRHGTLPAGEPVRTPGPVESGPPGFRHRELEGDVQRAQLSFGWRAVPPDHDDAPALDLAGTILASGRASRLYRAVRERGLASSVSAYHYTPTELGVFVVHAETAPEKTRDAARAIWTQVGRLRDEGPTPAELDRARGIWEARWLHRLESMEGQAEHLAEWEAAGDWRLGDRYLERILAVTADDVRRVMRRWLDPEQASLVAYRPRGTPPLAADAPSARALLDEADDHVLAPVADPLPAPALRLRPAALEREEGPVRVYRTGRGVPVLVRRRPGAPIAHLGVHLLGGVTDEPAAHRGITTLTARTTTKGTRTRTAAAIAGEAERLGGSVTSSVTSEELSWGISVPTRHLATAAALLADVVQHPTLPLDAVETERRVMLAELASLRDDMYRFPTRLALDAAFAGHPYGTSALGREDSLRAVDVEAARRWHRERVLRAHGVIALVGDVDPDEGAALLAGWFGELEAAEPRPVPAPAWHAGASSVVERDKAQTALALLFPGPSRRDPSRHAIELVAGIASGLGGRFFDELRDKRSLAYTVQAAPVERDVAGAFLAYIATGPSQEAEARAGLLAEFAKLRDELVDEEELARAQTYALGTHAIRQQSGGAVLGELVDAWLHGEGLQELDEYETRIREETRESLRDAARRWFDESRIVEGVVRGKGRE